LTILLYERESYFWRNQKQAEIDLIEESNGKLLAFEIKYSSTKQASMPIDFAKWYQITDLMVINRDNFLDYI
jgi:uncharacterized protein